MAYPVFYVPAGDVLPIFFDSYDGGTGASAATTGLATSDIEIYKDGSATQRSSDAGYTLLDTDGLDFDGITGINGFSIDTGDNTDSGFYTVGAWFTVVVSAVTIDAQTVNFIAAQFRLMPAEAVAGKPKVDVDAWLGTAAATPTVAGVPEVDLTHIGGTAATSASGIPEVKVASIANDAITANSIASDALTAAKIASDVATEIQSGLATAAELAKVPKSDSNVTWNATALASINTQADLALSDYDPPTKAELDSGLDALPTAAENADAVWDEAASGHVTAGTFGQAMNIVRANTAQAGASTTITLDASASAVDDFYNNTIIFITGGTGVGQSRIISDYVGSSKVATVSAWATNPSSDSVFVILPFGAIPGASAPTAGEIADAVWDEATSGHTTSGTFGEQLKTDLDAVLADTNELQTDLTNGGRLDLILDDVLADTADMQPKLGTPAGASISADIAAIEAQTDDIGTAGAGLTAIPWNAAWDAEVQSEVADALAVYDPPTNAELVSEINSVQSDIAALSIPTAAAIADAVWDEATTSHTTSGTFGEQLKTDVDAILADTNELQTDWTNGGRLDLIIDDILVDTGTTLQGELDGIQADTEDIQSKIGTPAVTLAADIADLPTNAELATSQAAADDATLAAIAGLNNLSAAQVNAEVLDVLNVDTFSEPGQGAPPASPTFRQMVHYLYKVFRNKKTQTATTFSLFADDGTTVDQKATVSDDGTTATSGEIATGP